MPSRRQLQRILFGYKIVGLTFVVICFQGIEVFLFALELVAMFPVGHLTQPVTVVDFLAAPTLAARSVHAATAGPTNPAPVGLSPNLRLPLWLFHGSLERIETVLASHLTSESDAIAYLSKYFKLFIKRSTSSVSPELYVP